MLDQILPHFSPHNHDLILVNDPDNVLADEATLAQLVVRGFSLIQEDDPVRLRHRLVEMGGFSRERPCLIITPHPLNTLPYDLWQQGRHLSLALHAFFPNLSYPVMQALNPAQRRALSQVPAPAQPLGRSESISHILRTLFGFTLAELASPATLVAWLNQYHSNDLAPLPPPLALFVQQQAVVHPAVADWPLAELLIDRHTFAQFVTAEWQAFVQEEGETRLGETAVTYHLPFASNSQLQDTLPQLVRSGVLPPLPVSDAAHVPNWARVAVVASPRQAARQQTEILLHQLADQTAQPDRLYWSEWQAVALTWANLTRLRYQPDALLEAGQQERLQDWQMRLDAAFLAWLRQHYALLAGPKLPMPGQVHHVPHFLAYRRRQHQSRLALLVLDGMSLADWLIIREVWAQRQPTWQLQEQLLLAQIPTITAVSRQALVSGLRPADFAASLHHNSQERKQWSAFWQQEDGPANAIGYAHLRLGKHPLPAELDTPRLQLLYLIHNGLDDTVHHASLGAAEAQASLRLWLQEQSPALEAIIARLLHDRFIVYLTSDHGHVEAEGMGQPDEGVMATTRGKRARLYAQPVSADAVQTQFPDTIRWQQDGLLPDGVYALMAGSNNGRRLAFAPENTVVVTHGGVTLDEMVLPLVEIGGSN